MSECQAVNLAYVPSTSSSHPQCEVTAVYRLSVRAWRRGPTFRTRCTPLMGSDAEETLSADTCRRWSATAARSAPARGVSGIARGVNGCTAAATRAHGWSAEKQRAINRGVAAESHHGCTPR